MTRTFAIGEELGDYRILAELDTGGMAALFLGVVREGREHAGTPVAVKAIRPQFSTDREFKAMFQDESRIVSRIRHPNVVRVFDWGRHEGKHFLVMEYLFGVSGSQLLRRLYEMGRTLRPEAAAAIAAQAAHGLHQAHELTNEEGLSLNVVHRDISPQNIMLTSDGHAKVIDFGIVKTVDRSHRTNIGTIKGKIRYMAPEQMVGGDVDRRADIFSLGVLLWETLATRRIYGNASDTQVITRATNGQIQPPGAFADVPYALDRVVMKALEPDPKDRFASALDFADAIHEASPQDVGAARLSDLVWNVVGGDLNALAERLPIALPRQEDVPREARARALRELTRMLDAEAEATSVGALSDYLSPVEAPSHVDGTGGLPPAIGAGLRPLPPPPSLPEHRGQLKRVAKRIGFILLSAFAAYWIVRSL